MLLNGLIGFEEFPQPILEAPLAVVALIQMLTVLNALGVSFDRFLNERSVRVTQL